VKDLSKLAVIKQIPTHEKLGIAFAKTNVGLCQAVNESLASIKESGTTFETLRHEWFDESGKG
jgi:hypothetical protein